MDSLSEIIPDLLNFLTSPDWKTTFSDATLTAGRKMARAKQVTSASAELLDTGDIEVTATILDPSGEHYKSTIAFWKENNTWQLDTSCSCSVRTCCHHAAATIEHLSRPGRLENAFGATSAPATKSKATQTLTPPPANKPTTETPNASQQTPSEPSPRFHLDIRHRPSDPRVTWLPEIYATAHVIYGNMEFPIDPAGNISAPRQRSAEMEALNTLYALDLLPGAEQPPVSLKKLPRIPEPLWAPNTQEWKPALYWQRFHHEGIAALEKRGWKVTVQPKAQSDIRPLTFRANTWQAEIVEEGKGWFNLSAGFEVDGEKIELAPILATLVEYNFLDLTAGMPDEQDFLIFLPDGPHAGRGLSLPVGRFRRILTHLGELFNFKFTGKPIKLHAIDAANLSEVLSEDDPAFTPPAPVAALTIQNASFNTQEVPVPSSLKATLRSYQLEGFQWMQHLAANNLHGVLADDMGLGKTMQSLTHILAEKDKGNMLPNLIIAPTSVVENWQREAQKFAPSLKVIILQGADRHRRFAELPHCDIAMTSYALLHRDLDHFTQQPFHLLILDEAQHIKNPDAQVSRAVRQLNARHRICLSGTPIENHLGELWSLFDFLMPNFLGTAETFRETFRTPIEKNGNQSRADSLAQKVGPLILRRTKDQVATELPPKTTIPHFIELGASETDLYETVRATMDKHVRQALESQGQQAQIVFLSALLKLRQICCHPSLIADSEFSAPTPDTASKFDYLTDLLATLKAENRRVLLFSQFTSMLDIIEQHLISQNTSYLKLTGATKNRHDLVDIFQRGETDVFLISLKAGGTGLTLTAADTVIHYDPWWNPAAENQATDRAYRIGQDKPVFVHKLICKGTVEERIQKMQDKKSTVADSILTASLNQLQLNEETLTELLR